MGKKMVFHKSQASGNDFVIIDNRKKLVRDAKKAAKALCDRHAGVGADGLLLFEPSKKADFKMRILNADGSEAEMCGNGSRCIGLYARKVLGYPAKFTMETLAGIIGVQVKGDVVKVRLSDLRDLRSESTVDVDGQKFKYYFVNTGVPHTVIFTDELESFPVDVIGHKIRYHQDFKPAGTNANFVQVTGKNHISVRTYERGVGETQACGTGSTASAIVSVLAGRCSAPVKVKTYGGEILNVYFEHDRFNVADIHLEGKAQIVFQGEIK